MNQYGDTALFEKIKKGDLRAYESIFHKYYGYLCLYANQILSDTESAEEIVQDFFVDLWDKREKLSVETSLKNYFSRSVKNRCINHIQHNKIKAKYAQKVMSELQNNDNYEDNYVEYDLLEKIEESIQLLPEKRREIFQLSRNEGLKYREIAEKLNISIKTVETQMSLAIKTLRDKLKKYIPFIILFLILN